MDDAVDEVADRIIGGDAQSCGEAHEVRQIRVIARPLSGSDGEAWVSGLAGRSCDWTLVSRATRHCAVVQAAERCGCNGFAPAPRHSPPGVRGWGELVNRRREDARSGG